MSREQVLAPLQVPAVLGRRTLGQIPILGDLPGNPVEAAEDLAEGKPFQSLIDRGEGLIPKAPKVPPLPPALPPPAPLPPTQRGDQSVGEQVGRVRRVPSSRSRNVFNVGGGRGVVNVQPTGRGGGRVPLGA